MVLSSHCNNAGRSFFDETAARKEKKQQANGAGIQEVHSLGLLWGKK
jgi:hypothetical protein